jgi:hypothetical protein
MEGKTKPHELPAMAKAEGHAVGIVTASPKYYAAAVLKNFRIQYDQLVTYHDTKNHKPDPEPLQLAMKQLGADPKKTIYIGDDPADVEAAYHAGVMSCGAGWGITNPAEIASTAPDAMLYLPDHFFPFSKLPNRQYVAERGAGNVLWHRGSVLCVNQAFSHFALGRYFATHDPRHASAKLSRTILEHKGSEAPAENIAAALAEVLTKSGFGKKYQYIVGVPPKPGQSRHRIGEVLEKLSKMLKRPKYLPDGLTCLKDYGDLKKLGPLERKEAVGNAFRTDYEWRKNNVLLIDDVLTTGSTSDECIRVLKANNAIEVALVVFAKDQRSFVRKTCPDCGNPMKIRTRKSDNVKFWGCSAYPNCKHTESI